MFQFLKYENVSMEQSDKPSSLNPVEAYTSELLKKYQFGYNAISRFTLLDINQIYVFNRYNWTRMKGTVHRKMMLVT